MPINSLLIIFSTILNITIIAIEYNFVLLIIIIIIYKKNSIVVYNLKIWYLRGKKGRRIKFLRIPMII